MKIILHDEIIKWKHFPYYWPFVRGIHQSPVNSLTKASDAEFWCFLWSLLNKRLSIQSKHWWFEKPSHPLWHHSNVIWGILIWLVKLKVKSIHMIVDCCLDRIVSQIAKTLGSIRHRSDTFALDRFLIDIDLKVFAICDKWLWCQDMVPFSRRLEVISQHDIIIDNAWCVPIDGAELCYKTGSNGSVFPPSIQMAYYCDLCGATNPGSQFDHVIKPSQCHQIFTNAWCIVNKNKEEEISYNVHVHHRWCL